MNNPTFVVLPSFIAKRIDIYMTKNNIEHKLLSEMEMCDYDVNPWCVYKGKQIEYRILCIMSELSEEEVRALGEKLKHTTFEELERNFNHSSN